MIKFACNFSVLHLQTFSIMPTGFILPKAGWWPCPHPSLLYFCPLVNRLFQYSKIQISESYVKTEYFPIIICRCRALTDREFNRFKSNSKTTSFVIINYSILKGVVVCMREYFGVIIFLLAAPQEPPDIEWPFNPSPPPKKKTPTPEICISQFL